MDYWIRFCTEWSVRATYTDIPTISSSHHVKYQAIRPLRLNFLPPSSNRRIDRSRAKDPRTTTQTKSRFLPSSPRRLYSHPNSSTVGASERSRRMATSSWRIPLRARKAGKEGETSSNSSRSDSGMETRRRRIARREGETRKAGKESWENGWGDV